MIVGACGFGSTGSSAVTDYLKEYNQFQVFDFLEFTWVSDIDGLVDLDQHLNHPHNRTGESFAAIERYKAMCKEWASILEYRGVKKDIFQKSVEDFLKSIVLTSWKWYPPECIPFPFWKRCIRHALNLSHVITKWQVKHGVQYEGFPFEDVYLSVKPHNFDEAAKRHVNEILEALGADLNKPLILDQPFPGNNPQSCLKFFDDAYAIVSDRDPRDNYVFSKIKLLGKEAGHMMPLNRVEDFVIYYKALRDRQPYKEKHDRVLYLKFEDMVYHYDDATKKIRDFLHLPENPNPKSIFNPAVSMPNTQVWKRYPQFAKDIEYIENELTEYLFDYSGCPEPDPNAQMFVGKSPLNPLAKK